MDHKLRAGEFLPRQAAYGQLQQRQRPLPDYQVVVGTDVH